MEYDDTWDIFDPADYNNMMNMQENVDKDYLNVAVVLKSPEAVAHFKALLAREG